MLVHLGLLIPHIILGTLKGLRKLTLDLELPVDPAIVVITVDVAASDDGGCIGTVAVANGRLGMVGVS